MPKIRYFSLEDRVKANNKLSISDIAVARYFRENFEGFHNGDMRKIESLLYEVSFLKTDDFLYKSTQREVVIEDDRRIYIAIFQNVIKYMCRLPDGKLEMGVSDISFDANKMHPDKSFVLGSDRVIYSDISLPSLPKESPDEKYIEEIVEALVKSIIEKNHLPLEPNNEDKERLNIWNKVKDFEIDLIKDCMAGNLNYMGYNNIQVSIERKLLLEEYVCRLTDPSSMSKEDQIKYCGNVETTGYFGYWNMDAEHCIHIDKAELACYLQERNESIDPESLLGKWLGLPSIHMTLSEEAHDSSDSLTAKFRMEKNNKLSIKDIAALIYFDGDAHNYNDADMRQIIEAQLEFEGAANQLNKLVYTSRDIERSEAWMKANAFKKNLIERAFLEYRLKCEPNIEISYGYRNGYAVPYFIRFIQTKACRNSPELKCVHGESCVNCTHNWRKYNARYDIKETADYNNTTGSKWPEQHVVYTTAAENCLIHKNELLNYLKEPEGQWLLEIIKGTLVEEWVEIAEDKEVSTSNLDEPIEEVKIAVDILVSQLESASNKSRTYKLPNLKKSKNKKKCKCLAELVHGKLQEEWFEQYIFCSNKDNVTMNEDKIYILISAEEKNCVVYKAQEKLLTKNFPEHFDLSDLCKKLKDVEFKTSILKHILEDSRKLIPFMPSIATVERKLGSWTNIYNATPMQHERLRKLIKQELPKKR